jgi:hypothetical protein
MENTFGKNPWTTQDGGACIKYFTMVNRFRNVVCSYKAAYDKQVMAYVGIAESAVNGQTGQLAVYADAVNGFRALHGKYLKMLRQERGQVFMFRDNYARFLNKDNGTGGNTHSLADNVQLTEATCHGGQYLGIEENSFLVNAVVRAETRHLKNVGDAIEKLLSTDIAWSEANEDAWGKTGADALSVIRRMGDLQNPTDVNSSDTAKLGAAPPVKLDPAQSITGIVGAGVAEDRIPPLVTSTVLGEEHYVTKAIKSPVGGFFFGLAVSFAMNGKVTGDDIFSGFIGAANLPTSIVAAVVLAKVREQQQLIAYYRGFAQNGAQPPVDKDHIKQIKSSELSKQFCGFLKAQADDAAKKVEEQRAASAAARQEAIETERVRMSDWRDVLLTADPVLKSKKLAAYCQKYVNNCPMSYLNSGT